MTVSNRIKTKLVVFDFDGTLSKPNALPNSWARIWAKIGRTKDDETLYQMYKNKELSYTEWAKEVIKVYREEKFSRQMLEDIAKSTILLDDSEEVLKSLYLAGIKVIILSGGIKNIIEYALGDNLKYIYKIEAQELIFDKDDIVEGVTVLDHFIEDKSQYMTIVLKQLNLKPEEVVFFGNSKNDEDVYKTGVKTICLNPDSADFNNRKIWKDCIKKTETLSSILKFIDKS